MKLIMKPASFRTETLRDGRQIVLPCDGRCICLFCTGGLTAGQKQVMLIEAQNALDEKAAKQKLLTVRKPVKKRAKKK
jgi:ferredoxin